MAEPSACVALQDGDDPEARRFAFDDLGNINDTKDFTRPYIEFYRSRDEVDLLVPILA